MPAELAVIIPTLNERDNIRPMLAALDVALSQIAFQAAFVDDDSDDGTARLVRSIAQTDDRVVVVQRINRRGLASAVIEGMLATNAPYLAVIDGDLQHDESILPIMFQKIRAEQLDLVIGSRYITGGGMGEFSAQRQKLSHFGKTLSRLVCRVDLSDPMSGFFMISREWLDEVVHSLSGCGFKILLDLVASSPRPVRFAEIGYTFRTRKRGESKLDIPVGLEYLELLLDKMVGNWIPVSLLIFGIVGTTGLLVYLLLVDLLISYWNVPLYTAQLVIGALVVALNFQLNNEFTFRRARLRGTHYWVGLLAFYVACSIGLSANWEIVSSLSARGFQWYYASVAGALAGSLWNYWISSILVWQLGRRVSRKSQRVAPV